MLEGIDFSKPGRGVFDAHLRWLTKFRLAAEVERGEVLSLAKGSANISLIADSSRDWSVKWGPEIRNHIDSFRELFPNVRYPRGKIPSACR
jgi:hypothetical protein